MAEIANPALAKANETVKVAVVADPAECSFQFNPVGTAKFTTGCDVAKGALARASVVYSQEDAPPGHGDEREDRRQDDQHEVADLRQGR